MKKVLLVASFLIITSAVWAGAEREEFFVACDAPVRVGGGIARHYLYRDEDRISARYSFAGLEGENLLIEKQVSNSSDGSSFKETIKIPFPGNQKEKKAKYSIGGHQLQFKLNGDGRLAVKEIKG